MKMQCMSYSKTHTKVTNTQSLGLFMQGGGGRFMVFFATWLYIEIWVGVGIVRGWLAAGGQVVSYMNLGFALKNLTSMEALIPSLSIQSIHGN